MKRLMHNTEVIGQTILSVVKGMAGFETRGYEILKKYGMENIKEDGWYLAQAWIDALRDIADEIGQNTLKAIGMKIIESAQWPPDVKTVEAGLASIDVAYHMNHRINGVVLFNPATGKMTEGIGHYAFKKLGDKEFEIICDHPYPCDMDKGIIKGVVEHFKTAGQKTDFFENKEVCRRKGGDTCTYLIKMS